MRHQFVHSKILVAVVCAIASVVGVVFFTYHIFQKEAELYKIGEEISRAQQNEDAGFAMKKLLLDTADKRAKIDSYFVGADTVVSFIESVEALSVVTKTKVSVNNVAVDKGSDESLFESLTLTATARGTFQDLYWLLTLIEQMPYQLAITRAAFEQEPTLEETKMGTWRLSFVISARKLK